MKKYDFEEGKQTSIQYTDSDGFKITVTFTNDEKKHEESVKAVKEFFMREVL